MTKLWGPGGPFPYMSTYIKALMARLAQKGSRTTVPDHVVEP